MRDGHPRRLALAGLGAALLAGMAGPALAQAWPNRTITLIVPFAAGGGTDAFARPLAQQLDTQLGQRVIVENRAGAGGTAGAAAAAKAAPDGYTFFMGAAHHAIAPGVYPKLSYDILTDFVPVAMAARPPHVIVVNPGKVRAGSVAELIAFAKANPERLTYGHAGLGTTHHLAGEMFKLQTGTNIRQVPYRGAGPMMADLVAGQVDTAFDGLGSSASQIASGTLKGLAVAAPKRVPAFPDLPTAAEAGLPGYEVSTWYGLFAVKGTPPEVVARMTREVRAALATAAIRESWEKNGSDVPDVAGDAFGSFVKAEVERWGKVARDANVKIE